MKGSEWGLRGIFGRYFPCDFIKDMAVPVLAGVIFSLIQYHHTETVYDNLLKLLNYTIVYLPVMATIILTAYTMMIAALKSSLDINNLLKNSDNQETNPPEKPEELENKKRQLRDLQTDISASFASNIVICILLLAVSFIIYLSAGFEISFKDAITVNSICYGILVTTIAYPVVAIIGIVSDMFSISRI